MRTLRRLLLVAFATLLVLPAAAQDETSLPILTVENLDASDREGFVFYSLANNEIVDEDGAWDLAFQGTRIRVNGSAQILEIPFELVEEAPEEGYTEETEDTSALPAANNQGWYSYDPSSHTVEPIMDRTLVFQLANGGFAKVEVVDYYDVATGTPRYYTFRYVYQADGTRMLK